METRRLDFDDVVVDGSSLIVCDDRLPTPRAVGAGWLNDAENLTALIRTTMKRYISHTYTSGRSTLESYLFDPAIERQAVDHALISAGHPRGQLSFLAICPPLRIQRTEPPSRMNS